MSDSVARRDGYLKRVVIAAVTLAAVLGVFLILRTIVTVFLLVFGAILLSLLLDGLASLVVRHTPLSRPWAQAVILVLLPVLLFALGWFLGPGVVNEVERLAERLPEAMRSMRENLRELGWTLGMTTGQEDSQGLFGGNAEMIQGIAGIFSTALGAISGLLTTIVIGIYLVIHRSLYIDNFIRLFPPERRERVGQALNALSSALKWWLVGQFGAMLTVGVLTTVGLLIIGLPLAVALGVIAGILSFVPFIGPIVAAIPALIIALGEEPMLAVWVLVVYASVQLVESNLITPLIQKKAVSAPPALLITVQIVMGVLAGLLGVLLATPLLVVAMVLVQMFYMEDLMGERVRVVGQKT